MQSTILRALAEIALHKAHEKALCRLEKAEQAGAGKRRLAALGRMVQRYYNADIAKLTLCLVASRAGQQVTLARGPLTHLQRLKERARQSSQGKKVLYVLVGGQRRVRLPICTL